MTTSRWTHYPKAPALYKIPAKPADWPAALDGSYWGWPILAATIVSPCAAIINRYRIDQCGDRPGVRHDSGGDRGPRLVGQEPGQRHGGEPRAALYHR